MDQRKFAMSLKPVNTRPFAVGSGSAGAASLVVRLLGVGLDMGSHILPA